jgi:hypothetical protein
MASRPPINPEDDDADGEERAGKEGHWRAASGMRPTARRSGRHHHHERRYQREFRQDIEKN